MNDAAGILATQFEKKNQNRYLECLGKCRGILINYGVTVINFVRYFIKYAQYAKLWKVCPAKATLLLRNGILMDEFLGLVCLFYST